MGIGKTLLKVAIGVVIAKGVASLTKGSSGSSGTVTAGRGSRIDTGSKGGLEDMMGDVLRSGRSSGRTSGGGQSGGGLGDLLDQLSGQKRQTPRATAPKGGLEDLLGELTGRGRTTGQTRSEVPTRRDVGGGGVGDLLDQVLADKPGGSGTLRSGPITLPEPEREEELSAALMLRAVIQAVKCDGELDEEERARLMQAMGEADQSEVQAVQAELRRPVDVAGLARSVPAGLEPQIYMVSLMALDLDQKAEADYLHQLAGALDLTPDQVNAIHDKAGVQRLYR
ncbi:MAG: DUF533 domain-containing protein [Tabrizicola sp.]|uniref:DUF533 domain-containing protein n=1 Tax=Tabrizicola sp. TaxID=2005166 RepID=UPI001B64ACDF|nr:DUF533 domain-containing protein [Tabrizicola sp.]